MILKTFTKQPAEIQDYDIDFTQYLESMGGDAAESFTTEVETGLTLSNSLLTGGVVKVFLSGGTAGKTYKVTVRLTTGVGLVRRVREAEIAIKVREF